MARPVADRWLTLTGAFVPRSFFGFALLFVFELGMVCLFGLGAINSGSWLLYLAGLVFLVAAIQNGVELTRTVIRRLSYKRKHGE